MRVGNDSLFVSLLVPSTDLNRIQTPHSLFGDLEQTKPLQLVGQVTETTEFKFEPKFKLLQVIWRSLLKAIPERRTIKGFDCTGKINGRAFGTALCSVCCALWHSFKLGRLETQSVSELAAVAAGSDRIAQGKCYHSCFTELV